MGRTTAVKVVKLEVPKVLLKCKDRPLKPEEGATQRDVGAFIIQLDEAGEDCRSKLQKIEILSEQ